jgi:hypothetical protein
VSKFEPERPLVQLKIKTLFIEGLPVVSLVKKVVVRYSRDFLSTKTDVRAKKPVHAAVQAFQRMRTVQVPSKTPFCGVGDNLTAARPLGRTQTFDECLWKLSFLIKNVLFLQESTGKLDRQRGILILVLSSQA